MCDLCREAQARGDEGEYCQECSRMVCYDVAPSSVDVISRACATESGDLVCVECAGKIAAAEEAERDRQAEYFPDPYDDDPFGEGETKL